MRLAKIRKIDIVVLLIFVAVCWFFIVVIRGGFRAAIDNDTRGCVDAIINYMNSNEGKLPSQQQLDKIFTPKNCPKFKINCEFKLEDVDRDDDKLIDRQTKKQVYILKGPYIFFIKSEQRKIFERASLQIYEEMIRIKNSQKK